VESAHQPGPAGLRLVHDAAATGAVSLLRAAVIAGAAALALSLGGCGASPGSAAKVSWDGKPLVVRQPELPDDTIVSGRMRNDSGETLKLDTADVRLVDPDGRAVQSTARFSTGVTHQLYPPREGPREKDPAFLRERLGEIATVTPGSSVPLVVSWRVRPGEAAPVRVDLGEASLDLP
jgi:hypothetical protein